jgi:heme exporter protein D
VLCIDRRSDGVAIKEQAPGASLTDFVAMGGYAAYVWSAYGFAALVLIALLVQSWRSTRRRDAELEQVRRFARPARVSRARLRPAPGSEADHRASAELTRPATE